MKRVCILTDLPLPSVLPSTRIISWREMWKMRPGVWALYIAASGDQEAEIIYLTGYSHLVVHELTHHAQHLAGRPAASDECEKEAYWVQSVYFRLFPEDWKEEWNP